MKRIVCIAFLVLASFSMAACAKVEHIRATQVLVRLTSELGAEVASVEASLFDENEQVQGHMATFPKAPPFSFAVVPPERSPARSNLIVVTAKDASGGVLAVAKTAVSFIEQQTVLVELRFTRICQGRSCATRQTCGASGDCVATPFSGTAIPPITQPGSEFTDITIGGATSVAQDSGSAATSQDAGSGSVLPNAGLDSAVVSAAGDATVPAAGDGGATGMPLVDPNPTSDASTTGMVMAECDNAHPCSAGYVCTNAKCTSACEQTSCDRNATCALSNGAPVCTCNSGFLTQGTGTSVTCIADVACTELKCDATNATCDRATADQPRMCKCKPGYIGNGMTCTPVSCGPLTIANGTVTGGTTYGMSATYRCSLGYQFASGVGSSTRMCGVDMQWTGTAPRCDPVSCGNPPAVANATVSPTGAGSYNSTASYTCNSGYMLSGTATITCQLSGSWTSRPSCTALPVCGNGRVETGEECERGALFTDPWKCNTQCKRTTVYNSCLAHANGEANSACSSGEVCTNGICTPSCSSSSQCPDPPSGMQKACITATSACLPGGCRSSGDCALGVGCVKDPGASTGACMGCRADEHCQSLVCTDINGGGAPLLGTFGRCQ